jgi:photosystem II stability/assembly factor-like uncharacterized protein
LVGDRGTILSSSDGGRQWSKQPSPTKADLQAAAADSELVGWAAGGDIQGYSHRSRGVLLHTRDGGQHWTEVGGAELSRIEGMRSFGEGHLLVWGDWSPAYQSGLLETQDGGRSWTPRLIPATHLQAAAWLDPATGVVVDRLSRVFFCAPGLPPQPLALGGNPTQPVRVAACNARGWWLAGAGGQVHYSRDGQVWQTRFLPGTAEDHRWIDIQAMALAGEECWLAGMPGNVVWHSVDAGQTWEIQTLPTSLPIYAMQSLHRDAVVAAGVAAVTHTTRNRGQAWWQVHGTASRIGMLNIASTERQLAWDALVYTANESRQHAAAVVIHAQGQDEQADVFPDRERRLHQAAHHGELSDLLLCPSFPLGELDVGQRSAEGWGYQKASAESLAPITRSITHWLRNYRPDIIVLDEVDDSHELQRATGEAIRQARRLAAEPGFRLFSPAAGIPENVWNCQRLLARQVPRATATRSNEIRKSDLNYRATTALKSSGTLLGQYLSAIQSLLDRPWEHRRSSIQARPRYCDYQVTFGQRYDLTKDNLFQDISVGGESRRSSPLTKRANLQAMIALSQLQAFTQRLLDHPGPDEARDARWLAALQAWLQASPAAAREDGLWDLSQGYRQRGAWNRYRHCLELLISETPQAGAAELAALELWQWHASPELRLLRRQAEQAMPVSFAAASIEPSNQAFASPFDHPSVDPASQLVQWASHQQPSPDTADETESLLALRRQLLRQFPQLAWDLRWMVLDAAASRYRPGLAADPTLAAASTRLTNFRGSYAWEEAFANAGGAAALTAPSVPPTRIPRTPTRPRLDGQLVDEGWQAAYRWPLGSAWGDDDPRPTELRLIYDDRFLYLSAICPDPPATTARSPAAHDEITLRIDTDGDFLTWFELSVNRKGEATERASGYEHWAPNWYFQAIEAADHWRLEAAIPLDALVQQPPLDDDSWSLAARREMGGIAVQMNKPQYSDQLQPTAFQRFRFGGQQPQP